MTTRFRTDSAAARTASYRRALGMTMSSVLVLVATGCASFAGPAPTFTPAPTLTPNVATVIPPGGSQAGSTLSRAAPSGGTSAQEPNVDPCAPPALPVVAVCLDEPWGLAPLPSGDAALVGERISGRIVSVRAGHEPQVVATITGLDASRGGGLLGLALSPYYVEDGLIYAYVTTPADARVVRLAIGQEPKAIVTGLPVGGSAMGGSLIFDAQGLLYIAVGSAATPHAAHNTAHDTADDTGERAAAVSAAVYRVDGFGHAAPANSSGTRLFADGLTDPTGMCLLPGGTVGAMDHRPAGDALIALADGREYRSLKSGDAVWTYTAGDGGAADCAVTAGELTTTGRTKPRLTTIEFGAKGGFTGSPAAALDGSYGLLRTAATGPGPLTWLTTANGHVRRPAAKGANASDDRVVVLPPSGAAGGGGGLD